MTRLALAATLALAAATTSAADLPRLPGEPEVAWQCRREYVPQARTCTAACEAAFSDAPDARRACVLECTRSHLAAMAECRSAASEPSPVVRSEEHGGPVAFR
jgi:hypothetical protein